MRKTNWIYRIISLITIIAVLGVIPADGTLLSVVTEEYELEPAMADGIFDGKNSDFDKAITAEIVDSKGKRIFNILEILPSERMGTIAYMIAGFEPVAEELDTEIEVEVKEGDETKKVKKKIHISTEDMRKACMDALFNRVPGLIRDEGGNNPQPNDLANKINNPDTLLKLITEVNNAMQECGGEYPFEVTPEKKYTGYYKYVGAGNGYYAKATKGKGDNVMVSKFHKSLWNNDGKFDYIWIEGDAGFEADNGDIRVTNQPRVKYKNNDKFFVDMYPVDDIEKFKNEHKIEVTTRTPATTSEDDIERADLIIINNAGTQMRYYPDALGVYNILHGDPVTTERGNTFFEGNDLKSFELAKKIYERVVVRQDVALISEKNTAKLYRIKKDANGNYVTQSEYWGDAGTHYKKFITDTEEIETNMAKLMRMLFFVNRNGEMFKGRDMFMDFMKCYVDEPGSEYMKLREENPDGKYLAPSLRGKPGNYMHYNNGQHIGHPLVKNKTMAIIGSSYNEGTGRFDPILATETDSVDTFVARRPDSNEKYPLFKKYFDWADIPFIEEPDPNGNGWDYRADLFQSRSNTTDFIYIRYDGTLVRDDKYSSLIVNDDGSWYYTGYWYEMDDDMGISRRMSKPIAWKAEEKKEWPWGVKNENVETVSGTTENKSGCLPYWFFAADTTGITLWGNNYCVGNLHLMFDYFSWGDYQAVQTPSQGRFENECLVQENEMYKNDWLKETIKGRKVKRENEGEGHAEYTTVKHYVSANIQNGDGGNKYKMTNKVLYYNSYERISEKESETSLAYIPLLIKIQTTLPVKNIELYNKNTLKENGSYTPFAVYELKGSNALSGDDIEFKVTRNFTPQNPKTDKQMVLENKTIMVAGVPKEVTITEEEKYNPYVYEAKLEDMMYDNKTYKNGRVNTIVIRVTIDKNDSEGKPIFVEDEVNVVKRDFFNLQ